jgi:hypothetical protein
MFDSLIEVTHPRCNQNGARIRLDAIGEHRKQEMPGQMQGGRTARHALV